ncbi:helix-turn-helix domain-containing protein [Pseudonocardia sp. TRM90224]|uniref:helix-turn-helix domain-containing protein n=1 Tax=Pseudonocardia sp. TRM90224 TaxID=2812678 RepID=UPI001E378AC7|nr:helix-turn-helix domain-containing protein [Pseudonocardia sp. TRM90224]
MTGSAPNRSAPHPSTEGPDSGGGHERAFAVLAMHRLGRRAEGCSAIVRWLGLRTGRWVGVVDRSGAVVAGSPPDPAVAAAVAAGVEVVLARGLRTFVGDGGPAGDLLLMLLDTPADDAFAVLVFAGADGVPRSLAADAATVLGTWWSAETTRRARRRNDDAEARSREAVLHLLMSRHVATARQIAAALSPALSPPLPDPVRVHVVECASDRRGEVVDRCREATAGNAWIVRCPVHARHVIVIAPAADARAGEALEVGLTGDIEGCAVGSGDAVALHDTAVGYEQAFHALAVARAHPRRWTRFDRRLDVAALIEPAGRAWAAAVLAPLLSYVPARSGDPDAQELVATTRSWLAFSMSATRHLKIHKNTLVGRLRHIEGLLGRDLGGAEQQAVLDLALRVVATPRSAVVSTDSGGELDDLLRLPAVQHWARALLDPLSHQHRGAGGAVLEATLRAWLRSDARLSATADTLGISVPGARKRLCRLEQELGRSLLRSPSARHDLWLAVRAVDLAAAGATV